MITFSKTLLRAHPRYAMCKPCVALLLIALCGCVQTEPYRVVAMPNQQATCDPVMNSSKPDENGSVPTACANDMLEHASNYDLLFTEFDDQGWANNPNKIADPILHTMQAGPSDPSTEFGNLKKFLHDEADNYPKLLIITFVHGWKHNASTDDANVKLFRQVLENTAALEKETNAGPNSRHIVGVYLGWRGDSLNAPDGLKSVLTFYDRKGTADKVSKGAIHEVIAYLNAYERRENRLSDGKCDVASAAEGCKVVSVFIGHSFGGLILFEAIAPAVLSSIIDGEVYSESNDPLPVERFGDMVVLINPAIEAARFQPLFRAVATYQPKHYRSPLMVLVTTDADIATGTFFPLGRFFSTLFETKTDQEQRDAVLETIGHMKPYLTHYLHHFDTTPPGAVGNIAGVWPRQFGDQNVLYVCSNKYASYPVWNVETDKTVMTGHSDLDNPNLRNFVVALINDAIVHSERMKRPPAQQTEAASAQGGDVSIDCLSSDNYDRLKTIAPAQSH